MLRVLWTVSVRTRDLTRRYLPTNILLDFLRTRPGLKWGVPAMLLAVPYLAVAVWCASSVADGGPGWLNLIILVAIWNAMKFIVMGPVSVLTLARRRWHERSARRGALPMPTH